MKSLQLALVAPSQRWRWLALILCLLASAAPGCNLRSQSQLIPPNDEGIVAAITLPCTVCNTRDFSVRVVFTNVGEERVKLNHYVVQFPQLVLAVFTSRGKLLSAVPPPDPPPELAPFDKVLFPGESYEVSYPLPLRAALLPDGQYSLRARFFRSNTVQFRLAGLTD